MRHLAALLLLLGLTAPALRAAPECRMDALAEAERARHAELSDTLSEHVIATRSVRHGAEFSLRPDPPVLGVIGEWLELERRCCPWVEVGLEWERLDRPIRVRVTGPAGSEEMIRAAWQPSDDDEREPQAPPG